MLLDAVGDVECLATAALAAGIGAATATDDQRTGAPHRNHCERFRQHQLPWSSGACRMSTHFPRNFGGGPL
jgi:hypothetical protein